MVRRRLTYTNGELNRLIDGLIHSKARKDPSLWVLDGLLHAIVEQNPKVSAKKFLLYDGPEIIKQIVISGNRSVKPRRRAIHR